ncbi:MAG TPA: sugar ABC transporter ATPase, partial [Bacteroidia bacterium]
MSDNSITIVPKISTYAGNKTKAKEILQWLTSLDVVKPFLSDCVLSEAGGYSVSDSAKIITTEPELVPTGLGVNGLEIITRRQI